MCFFASHPWSHVVIGTLLVPTFHVYVVLTLFQGMWHKYPNPHCSHVLSVDVIDRSVDPATGVVRTERILGCKQKAPTWILKVCRQCCRASSHFAETLQIFGGSEDAFVREVSYIDPTTQNCTITSVNLSLSQFATCNEQIQYLPSPIQPKTQTLFSQTAEIQARMTVWRSMSDKLESWLADRFAQNAQKGKLGFTDVLRSLWDGQEQHAALH